MSASDTMHLAIGYASKLTVDATSLGPKVSKSFRLIGAASNTGRLHRLGPGSDFDMPKTTATVHRYLPYLQQVTASIN